MGNIINKNGAINAVEFNEVAVISAKHSITKDDKIISSKFVEIPVIDGLVGYYPLNGNANDYSGSGYNGTVSGATLAADRFGNADSCYSFDGINDYIDLNRNLLTYPENFTLSIWVYNDTSGGTAGTLRVWDGGIGGSAGYYGFGFVKHAVANTKIAFQIKDTNNNLYAYDTLSAPNLTWINYIITKNGTEVKIYENTVLKSTKTLSISTYTVSRPTGLGGQAGGVNFKGKIDDVRIYDRALTEKEIALLFDYGKIKLEKNGLFYTKEIEEI